MKNTSTVTNIKELRRKSHLNALQNYKFGVIMSERSNALTSKHSSKREPLI